MTDESELVVAAKGGSVEAFTALVARYREGLLRFLLTRCNSHADAEDALQDTLMSAFRYLETYDPRWRFSTWLYRIAVNNASAARMPPAAEPQEIADESADPLALCAAASERSNLWLSARRILADDVFTALWLRYAEDMSVNDIARVVGRTTSWTKVNLMRARRALEATLARDNGMRSKASG